MKNSDISKMAKEIRTTEVSKNDTNIDALLQMFGSTDLDIGDMDEQLALRLEQQKDIFDTPSFSGNPSEAKRYIDQQGRHLEQARKYEREANSLEREIKRGNEPANRMSDVKNLRRKAESEKQEANRCKRKAESILNG